MSFHRATSRTAVTAAPVIDPEAEVARLKRWWSGWDQYKAGNGRPVDPDAAEGYDSADTAARLRMGFIQTAKGTGKGPGKGATT